MAKSSGARPRKAQRAEVQALREKLGELHAYEWQKAHVLFQRICELCNHRGARGGMGSPYPRACKFCHRYGHSTQFYKAYNSVQGGQGAPRGRGERAHPRGGPGRARIQMLWVQDIISEHRVPPPGSPW